MNFLCDDDWNRFGTRRFILSSHLDLQIDNCHQQTKIQDKTLYGHILLELIWGIPISTNDCFALKVRTKEL